MAAGSLLTVVLGLCVALLILSANGLALVLDAGFYARGEVAQRVDEIYGLEQEVLGPVNVGIVDFFGGDRDLADSLRAAGADPAFFGERETVHMEDVRGIVRIVGSLERAAIGLGLLSLVSVVALFGRGGLGRVGVGLAIGGGLTIALVVVLGALTLSDFGSLFTQLHMLSFTNDFWILDPRTDHLIQMFPFGFWQDATIALAGRWLASAIVAVVLGATLGRIGRWLA